MPGRLSRHFWPAVRTASGPALVHPGYAPAAVRVPRIHRRISSWITAREAFGVTLESLSGHKLRSFLTLLGVVISTTTLIVVMSIVNGMNVYIAERIANLGTNTFVLHQFQWAQGFESYLQARRRNQPIRIEDFGFLEENLQGYLHMGALAQPQPGPQARYRDHSIDEITLNAVTPGFVDVGREKIAAGRYISDTDYRHKMRVCVIGQDLAGCGKTAGIRVTPEML